MREWASSGRIKIDRADEHIRHLEAEVNAFVDRRPFVVAPEADGDANNPAIKRWGHRFIVTERESIPPRWTAIVADAVHNLHTALDHMWQRLTTKSGRRKNYFPIFRSPDAAKTFLGRKEKGRRHPAVDILLSVNAFEIGNPFWRIREFDDTDKHDTVTLVACYPGTLTINAARMHGTPIPANVLYVQPEPRTPRPRFPVLENGAVIYLHPFEPKLDVDIEVAPLVAFDEGGLMEGEAVVPTLQNLFTAVDSLASAFIAAKLLR